MVLSMLECRHARFSGFLEAVGSGGRRLPYGQLELFALKCSLSGDEFFHKTSDITGDAMARRSGGSCPGGINQTLQ